MFRIILIIFLFFEIFSYDKASFDIYKHSLKICGGCNKCIPYRLKISSDGNITVSIPSLYNTSNSIIGNCENCTLVKLNSKDNFKSLLNNYNNLYSVMGYCFDKNNKYYILDQGKIKISENNGYFVENNTPKLVLYNSNNGKITEFKFEGIDLNNPILTDVIVDHEGKYAYITDSGNIKKDNSNSGIIIINLETKKVYRILNNHSSFKADKNFNFQNSLTNNEVKDFISNFVGVNNIEISCDDETLFYTSLKSNNIYSVSTKDILNAIEKYDKSQNLNDLKDIKVNSANKTFISENYIISSKNNIFMTNSETKSVDVSFYVDGDLSYFNPNLNSKKKTNDNKNNYNLQYSLDINEDNLYLLTNSFDNEYNLKNCSIYKAKLKTDELNNNKGCSIFIFKLSGGIIFLLIWFFIILCVVILIIIMNSGTDLEQTHLLKEMAKEAEINELNRELNG